MLPRLHWIDKSIGIGNVLSHIDIGNFYPNEIEKSFSIFQHEKITFIVVACERV